MSSQALARQYRSRTFHELVGQEHVTQALVNALTRGRLHHAYLFTGTRGVGKTSVSRILAKSLNCQGADGQGGVTSEPCGVCPACRDIDAGRFVDYVELDAASNRGVEEISQLLDQAVYKPVVGRTKVYLIDEVHMLSTHAFNAMLKTLEEPPDYLKFILATTDPQKVPPTVLSRCLQFNLRPLPPPLVQAHLARVLAQEQVPAEAGALRLLARAARGSMRDALSLTDQALAFSPGALQEDAVQRMLGATPRSHVLALLQALADHDGPALAAEVDALRAAGHAAQGTADEMARWLQTIALAQAAPQALDPQDPDTAEALRLAPGLPADELQLTYRLLLQSREELPLCPDEHAGLLMVLLRALVFRPAGGAVGSEVGSEVGAVAAPPQRAPLRSSPTPRLAVPVAPPVPVAMPVAAAPVVSRAAPEPQAVVPPVVPPATAAPARPPVPEEAPALDELLAREREMDAALALEDDSPPVPHATEAASDAAAQAAPIFRDDTPATFAPTAEGETWARCVADLAVVGLARSLALQAQCLAWDETAGRLALRLRTASPSLAQGLSKLQAALEARQGHEVHVQLDHGPVTDTPQLRDQAAAAERMTRAQRELDQSPALAALRAHFPTTRVVPGSVKPLAPPISETPT